jgi:uncharacterized SAM-dependent methyltransferase
LFEIERILFEIKIAESQIENIIFEKRFNSMLTINTILKELKDVPVNRLEELYQFVNSLTPKINQKESSRKKIISFGGSFGDMSDKDYADFLSQTKKARTTLFVRNLDL